MLTGSGTVLTLMRMYERAYGNSPDIDDPEAAEAQAAVCMVQCMDTLLPSPAEMGELFRAMLESITEREGNSPRAQRIKNTYRRIESLTEAFHATKISVDLEAVRFAEIAFYLAMTELNHNGPLTILRGDCVSGTFRGSVLTGHFDNGISLEMTLTRDPDRGAWMLDGGIWPRHRDDSGIWPTVEIELPSSTKIAVAKDVVKNQLSRLLLFCQPVQGQQQEAMRYG